MITAAQVLSAHQSGGRRWLTVNAGLLGLCLVLALVSMSIGRVSLPLSDIVSGVFGGGDARVALIVQELRLPRTLLALAAGAATGMAGAVLQGLLRNPLAEPGVLGISTAASLGAVIAIYFGLSAMFPLALPMCAMGGAAIATMILYAAGINQASTLTMILTGMGVSSTSLALISLAMNMSPNPWAVSEMVFWLLGSVKNRTLADVWLVAPFVGVGLLLLARAGRALDAFSLGEEAARSLGIDPQLSRLLIVSGVTLAVGGTVAVTGGVGFVGLIVPHLLRPLVGHVPSRLLLPSGLGGAALVLASDIGIRLMAQGPELNLGVITSLIGAPMFVYLVIHTRREAA